MPKPVACITDFTDFGAGMCGVVALAPGGVGVTAGAHTVFAEGRPVATVTDSVLPHGNYTNPRMPGFNPVCSCAVLTGFNAAYTVFVEGKPLALLGTMASCTHFVAGACAPTVICGDV